MRLRPTPETDCIVRNAANNHHPTSRLAATLTVKCEKLERERDEARNALRLIADDCEAWLAGESDEPSMDFIKAVRDYARKAING